MQLHVGLDISQRKTAICIVNEKGKIICEGNALTLPSDIHRWLVETGLDLTAIQAICLEAGSMSSFIYKGLEAVGLPVVCVEAFQAAKFHPWRPANFTQRGQVISSNASSRFHDGGQQISPWRPLNFMMAARA